MKVELIPLPDGAEIVTLKGKKWLLMSKSNGKPSNKFRHYDNDEATLIVEEFMNGKSKLSLARDHGRTVKGITSLLSRRLGTTRRNGGKDDIRSDKVLPEAH